MTCPVASSNTNGSVRMLYFCGSGPSTTGRQLPTIMGPSEPHEACLRTESLVRSRDRSARRVHFERIVSHPEVRRGLWSIYARPLSEVTRPKSLDVFATGQLSGRCIDVVDRG